MEKKFTPGPWSSHAIVISYGGQSAADGHSINATSGNSSDWYGLARVVTETEDGTRDEEGIANAHLIAAAPDLYDALEEMVLSYEHEASMDNPALLQAKAALAKARGEA